MLYTAPQRPMAVVTRRFACGRAMRRHVMSCCVTTDGPHQKPVAVQLGVIVVTVVVTAAAAARRRAEVCAVVVR